MAEIKLVSGQVAYIDDVDLDVVLKHRWYVERGYNTSYARTLINGKWVKMHRLLLCVTDAKIFVDHKDGNGLNNTRGNIRTCTRSDNSKNKKPGGVSKYMGVSLHPSGWLSNINVDGKPRHLGLFEYETDAAKAYNEYALKYGNEFHRINVILEETHKKARAISLTDAEYSNLKTKAEAERLGVSAYIIKKLKLK